MHAHGLQVWLPHLQFLFRVAQHLPGVVGVGEGLPHVTRDDGGVIEVVEQATAVFGENDLLFGALDRRCEV